MSEMTFNRVMVGETCPTCQGSGKFATSVMTEHDGVKIPLMGNCLNCGGTGVANQQWVSLHDFVAAFWKEAVKMGRLGQ